MQSRVEIETLEDGVRLTAPPPRSRWAVNGLILLAPAFAFAILVTVVFFESLVRMAAGMPAVAGVAAFLVVATLPVAVDIALLAIAVLLMYRLFGREIVVATPWMLTDSRVLFGLSWSRHWPVVRVDRLRLSPMAGGTLERRFASRRGLLFEVDGKSTRSMCEGCTPAEAAEALAALKATFSLSLMKRRESR